LAGRRTAAAALVVSAAFAGSLGIARAENTSSPTGASSVARSSWSAGTWQAHTLYTTQDELRKAEKRAAWSKLFRTASLKTISAADQLAEWIDIARAAKAVMSGPAPEDALQDFRREMSSERVSRMVSAIEADEGNVRRLLEGLPRVESIEALGIEAWCDEQGKSWRGSAEQAAAWKSLRADLQAIRSDAAVHAEKLRDHRLRVSDAIAVYQDVVVEELVPLVSAPQVGSALMADGYRRTEEMNGIDRAIGDLAGAVKAVASECARIIGTIDDNLTYMTLSSGLGEADMCAFNEPPTAPSLAFDVDGMRVCAAVIPPARDPDSEEPVELVTLTPVGGPHGGAEIAGTTVCYEPSATSAKEERYEYRVRDAEGAEATGTLTFVNTNAPPEAPAISVVVDAESVCEPVLSRVTDPDGPEPLSLTDLVNTGQRRGYARISGDAICYWRPEKFWESETYEYTVIDGMGAQGVNRITFSPPGESDEDFLAQLEKSLGLDPSVSNDDVAEQLASELAELPTVDSPYAGEEWAEDRRRFQDAVSDVLAQSHANFNSSVAPGRTGGVASAASEGGGVGATIDEYCPAAVSRFNARLEALASKNTEGMCGVARQREELGRLGLDLMASCASESERPIPQGMKDTLITSFKEQLEWGRSTRAQVCSGG
jgi:hypothetical protein